MPSVDELVYNMDDYCDEVESEEHTATGHGIRRRTHPSTELARRKSKKGSFVGSISGSGSSIMELLLQGGSGRSMSRTTGRGRHGSGDGGGTLDLPLKNLVLMAEDECLDAALGDVEVPLLPRALWFVFSVTGVGPCRTRDRGYTSCSSTAYAAACT